MGGSLALSASFLAATAMTPSAAGASAAKVPLIVYAAEGYDTAMGAGLLGRPS